MPKINILIADDHTLIRETWSFILKSDKRFSVVAEAGSGAEAVKLTRKHKPDIVLMDINMPGINGIEATKKISKIAPLCRVLAISLHTQPAYARMIMNNGAMGYVTKNSSKEEMMRAILEIHAGNEYVCEEMRKSLSTQHIRRSTRPTGLNALTGREIEIITRIRKGESSREIAESLSISLKTVEVHRYNILKKLKLKNVSALVNFSNRHAIE